MPPQPLAAVLTLGCKLNLADSEEVARGLRAAGFATVDHVCEADAYVVNTCSVTHVADRKSRRLIRSLQRLAPGAPVAVTGCYPRSAGEETVAALGADLVVGTTDDDKARLVDFLSQRVVRAGRGTGDDAQAPSLLHTRAFVKAQEGCNDVCAFCIVPRTRGREASRSIQRVVAEVNAGVEAGAREVVITGTQLGAWGRDLDANLKPHHLIAGILESTDVPRLRFSSLQPQDITPELLALWQDPRLMPHFHLALQSGSDVMLSAMRRRYTASEFLFAAERIRAASPDAAITSDVIAGFPGETEADFERTRALCQEAGFARLHCFPYSQRAGTVATRIPGQVPPAVRKERLASLIALGDTLSLAFRQRFAGAIRPVLWENEQEVDGQVRWFGHTDNYIAVYMAGTALRRHITPVSIAGVYHDGVEGGCPREDA